YTVLHQAVVKACVGWCRREGITAYTSFSAPDYKHHPDFAIDAPGGTLYVEVKTGWWMKACNEQVAVGRRQYAGGPRPLLIALSAAGDVHPAAKRALSMLQELAPSWRRGCVPLRAELDKACAVVEARRAADWAAAVSLGVAPTQQPATLHAPDGGPTNNAPTPRGAISENP